MTGLQMKTARAVLAGGLGAVFWALLALVPAAAQMDLGELVRQQTGLGLATGPAPVPGTQPGAPLQIKALRAASHAGVTRFTLDLSAPVSAEIFTLTGGDRLVLDLPDVDWPDLALVPGGREERGMAVFPGEGLVEAVRFSRSRPGQARLVLDLNAPAAIAARRVAEGPETGGAFRLTLDLRGTSRAEFERTAGWPARHLLTASVRSAPAQAVTPKRLRPRGEPVRRTKPVIVLDPGHGGRDPGAVGVTGLHEKDVALAMAKQLKTALEAGGRYTVHLTRSDDRFIELPDRVAFARRKGANLFISVHADSNPDKTVRGTSVYTLSERASDKAAARLARKENAINGLRGQTVSDDVLKILIELAQRDTMNNSVQFAQTLLPALDRRDIGLLRNTHRFGPFWVLTGADVPSVLLEMGFLSNRQDSALLASATWRARLATGITAAVDSYFDRLGPLAQRQSSGGLPVPGG